MAKREVQKEKLISALKAEISQIENGIIKGVLIDFKINSVTIYRIEILSPTDGIDEDDFENANEIDFEADVTMTLAEKQVTNKCRGTAKTEYIDDDFNLEIESYRFSSLNE